MVVVVNVGKEEGEARGEGVGLAIVGFIVGKRKEDGKAEGGIEGN